MYVFLEPVPTPPPTFSETVFAWVSNTVDKAIFLRVDTEAILYDTAYVELTKAVEAAMEIPVIEIREDLAALCYTAYQNFEEIILDKERIGKLKELFLNLYSILVIML